jgi:hypothetical protein
MLVFEQEIQDGLEERIKSQASISYACHVEPSESNNHNIKNIKSLASLSDNDLYYVQSILVTSSWNKNDDIFDKSEIWLARHTPEDKPTNLEHDEALIIGHITSNWPITDDGILINDNTPIENLPNKYHILTGSVIYRAFTNPELKGRSEKLISEIENGTKYVSMECYFKGFDYGLQNKDTGEFKVLARNNDTAFLTKHLRAYGGIGEHDGYKVGRVLRNVTFSGKGFVDRPANPDSVIFTKDILLNDKDNQNLVNLTEKKDDLILSGVSTITSTAQMENVTMSVEQEIADMKTKLEAMNNCSDAVKDAYAQASELKEQTNILETAIKAHEDKIAELTAALEAAVIEKEEAAKKKTEEEMTKEEEMKKVKSELEAANEVIAGYKMKEEEMAKKEKKMKRVADLLETGLNNDTVIATVDQFEHLDDSSFEGIKTLLVSAMKKEAKPEVVEKKKASEEIADESVLETAEPEQTVELGVGGEPETEVSNTRAALVDFVCSRLGKTLNKGE